MNSNGINTIRRRKLKKISVFSILKWLGLQKMIQILLLLISLRLILVTSLRFSLCWIGNTMFPKIFQVFLSLCGSNFVKSLEFKSNSKTRLKKQLLSSTFQVGNTPELFKKFKEFKNRWPPQDFKLDLLASKFK